MEENKKGKGLTIILLVLLLLLVGALCFGGYKYLSLDKEYKKISNENKSIAEELKKQKETNQQVSNTNDYNLFVKKMKEERTKLNTTSDGWKYTVSFDTSEDANDYHPAYTINLTTEGILSVNKKTIANNVLFYRILNFGNGGFKGVYYVTEDGTASFADVEYALYQKRSIKVKKIDNTANIVNILPGFVDEEKGNDKGPGGIAVYFVDINGNIIHE